MLFADPGQHHTADLAKNFAKPILAPVCAACEKLPMALPNQRFRQ